MAFSNNFVVCVLVDGKVARERKAGRVPVPFGTEYTIRLRNKNDRDAVATIKIDGENVSGNGWIVRAKSHEDIERRLDSPTKFKFVSQDSGEAVDAGKNGDPVQKNGLIEVSWRLVKPPTPAHYVTPRTPLSWVVKSPPQPFYHESVLSRPVLRCAPSMSGFVSPTVTGTSVSLSNVSVVPATSHTMDFCVTSDAGCTVEGSHSNQSVNYQSVGELEAQPTVITLLLVGCQTFTFSSSGEIITAKPTKFCEQCGAGRNMSARFCGDCGTRF